MQRILILAVMMAMILGFSMQTQAALDLIGTATYNSTDYNLIYDDDFEITWLDYSNPIANWDTQNGWAEGLNNINDDVLTYNFNPGVSMTWSDDWRLPSALNQDGTDPCGVGINCTDSEMGHLYYDEGVTLFKPGVFQNLREKIYWYGTEYASDTDNAWKFDISDGYQGLSAKTITPGFYGIAVRPGMAVVPEPISSILFIVGGATLGLRRYRKKFIT